jgi:uncharacterized OB-fold protein
MRDAGVTQRRAPGARGELLVLRCPLCGLTVAPRASWPAITYCPRCLARSKRVVELTNAGKAQRAPTRHSHTTNATTNQPHRTRRPTGHRQRRHLLTHLPGAGAYARV